MDETPFLRQWKKDAQALMEKIEAQAFGAPQKRCETTLAFRNGAFVSLEIGDDGKVIEPPKACQKCGPVLLCAEHMAMIS